MVLRQLFRILLFCSILSISAAGPAQGQTPPIQPRLVRDINTCTESASPGFLAQTDSVIFFTTSQAMAGRSLWRSDGSEAGTVLIKMLSPDTRIRVIGQNLWLGNFFYFIIQISSTQEYFLWASDGTEAGTHQIKNLQPGIDDANFSDLVIMNGALYFTFEQEVISNGNAELWRSDGTPEGTQRIVTLQSGDYQYFSNLTAYNGYLYFSAWDAEHGMELWRSDGTVAGTGLFLDLNPAGSASPDNFYATGETLYFIARHESGRWVLWSSNGTPAGTRPVLTEGYDPVRAHFTNLNGILYFPAYKAAGGLRIWRTDGTDAGTWMLKDVDISVHIAGKEWKGLGIVGNTLYFPANQTELWKSDGTEAGTVLVKNLYTNYREYTPAVFLDVGGILYFGAYDWSGTPPLILWRSDGTEAGTTMVDTGNLPNWPAYIESGPWLIQQNQVVFSGYVRCSGDELQRVDETAVIDGTARAEMVKDIETKTLPSSFNDPVAYQGRIYFSADDGLTGSELWTSDGTEAGTHIVKDIYTVKPGGVELQLGTEAVNANGLLFFPAFDALDTQLWRTDGTEAGTIRLTDLVADFPLDGPHGLAAYHDKVYFLNNAAGHEELWASDGTPSGTGPFHSFGRALFEASPPVALNGWLYLLGLNTSGKTQLYRSDGNQPGTTLLREWDSSGASSPGPFIRAGGRLFFTAWDAAHGRELWASDGTPPGTALYADLTPGATSTTIETITAEGNYVLFSTWSNPDWSLWKATVAGNTVQKLMSSTHQYMEMPPSQGDRYIYFTIGNYSPRTLWRTDGTPEGTIQLWSTSGSYLNMGNLAVVGDRVYFNAADVDHGDELWTSDGTPEGTHLAFDLLPGPASSSPESIFFVNGALWFRADDGVHGSEPWIYDFLTEHFYLPVMGR